MQERYTKLYSLDENLYSQGTPIIILAGALHLDNKENRVCVQLKMLSLSNKPIKAVKVHITCFDVSGTELSQKVLNYLDLAVSRNALFGQDKLLAVDNELIRQFTAKITELIYADGEVFTSTEDPVALGAFQPLSSHFSDPAMLEFYKQIVGKDAIYCPRDTADLWVCTCGTFNNLTDTSCCSCGKLKEKQIRYLDTSEISEDIYKKAKDIAEKGDKESLSLAFDSFDKLCDYKDSKELAGQCRAKIKVIDEQFAKAATKKKARIIKIVASTTTACAIFIVVLFTVIIPSVRYNNALKMVGNGQYDEAIAIFEDLGNYKDSVIKKEETYKAKAVYLINSGNLIYYPQLISGEVRWGYADKEGTFLIEPQFDYAKSFADNGLALVRIGDWETGKYGYIDSTGKYVIEPQFDDAGDFTDNGLACVRIGDYDTGKCGYIDITGKYVIEPQFDYADDFTDNGLARVRIGDWETGKYGYIDITGKYVIEPVISY